MKLTREKLTRADTRTELNITVGRGRTDDRSILRDDHKRVHEVHEGVVGQAFERRSGPPPDTAGGVNPVPAHLRHLEFPSMLSRIAQPNDLAPNQPESFMPSELVALRHQQLHTE